MSIAGRLLAGVGYLAVAWTLLAPAAAGAEITREEYVSRAEPICKANVLANKRIFKGAKGEVKAGKLKKASRHFLRAATAFTRTVRQIEAVPPLPADEARLSRWLDLLHAESGYVRRIGEALAVGEKHKAEAISVRLNRNSTRANNVVLVFGFDYCRIDPSRFG